MLQKTMVFQTTVHTTHVLRKTINATTQNYGLYYTKLQTKLCAHVTHITQ